MSKGEYHQGTLKVCLGPMFSGKTTWLNNCLTQMADTGFLVLRICHSDDQRDDVVSSSDSVTTHNSSYNRLSSKIVQISVSSLSDEIINKELQDMELPSLNDYHVLGIDEGQFFDDIVETVDDWVNKRGRHVIVAALNGDFRMKKFGKAIDLLPLADKVKLLKAKCRNCLETLQKAGFEGDTFAIKAPFTGRIVEGTAQKLVGGSDLYIPLCRYHHHLIYSS